MSRTGPTTDKNVPGSLSTEEKKLLRKHLEEFQGARKSDRTQIISEAYLELGQTLVSKKVSETDSWRKLHS
jgi:hypothetical protein